MINKISSLPRLVQFLLSQNSLTKEKIEEAKRAFAKNTGTSMPKNSAILKTYRTMKKQGKVVKNSKFEDLLRLKKVRSLSGIVPVAVLTKPYPCPGNCVYCPTQENMPKSYIDNEPAAMRADMADFDPYLQVKRRLDQLHDTGHSVEKIELIIMGGTFTHLPWKYRKHFLKRCFDAANQKKAENLQHAQEMNQKAKRRIIGITLETRPDEITEEEIVRMRKLGGTRLEIGVQSTFNQVLKKVNRGHGVEETIKATKLLKNAGFKICYHLMPNLPGSNLEKDLQMFKIIFNNPDFKPDMIKVYPCVVTYQAELYQWYKDGKFQPYQDQELIDLLTKIKSQHIPEWVRINRLGRDIPIQNIAAGTKISNIRQVVQKNLEKNNKKCPCIRCREIKSKNKYSSNLKLKVINYQASQGKEYFLQFVDSNNNLYALLRLRIPSQTINKQKHFIKALQNSAIIRELHTYGKALPVGKEQVQTAPQHRGLGKKLIKKAEEIVQQNKINKIAVISGVGVREYYKKLGYSLSETYMVKKFDE
jgi:elongator complex protein 3